MTEKSQEHRLPLRPGLQCTLLLERVVMLVKSLNVIPKSLGPAPSSSFHLKNEQRGELILCRRASYLFSKAQRTGIHLVSELTSMKVSMKPSIRETKKV